MTIFPVLGKLTHMPIFKTGNQPKEQFDFFNDYLEQLLPTLIPKKDCCWLICEHVTHFYAKVSVKIRTIVKVIRALLKKPSQKQPIHLCVFQFSLLFASWKKQMKMNESFVGYCFESYIYIMNGPYMCHEKMSKVNTSDFIKVQ